MCNVYITGIGVLSNAGNSIDEFWNNIIMGYNTPKSLPLEIPKIISHSISRRMDRFSQMALVTSKNAFMNSSLEGKEYNPFDIGTVFNTSYGPLATNIKFLEKLNTYGPDLVSPIQFASTVYNACIGHICINLKLKGVSTMLMGSNNVGYAYTLLKYKKARAVLTGALDEYNEDLYNDFNYAAYVNHDVNVMCKPLDMKRNGTKVCEGCAVVVLETEESMYLEKNNIYCQVLGCGDVIASVIPGRSEGPIEPNDFVDCMEIALQDAGITYRDVDAIIMAANGNIYGDKAEAIAIGKVFKEKANEIPALSIKGSIGETMGASLTFNIVAAALSLKEGVLPPTSGCKEIDRDLNLNIVHGQKIKGEFKCILVNGYDISGSVSTVILKNDFR